jgi:rhodanese-related sulfurtransferase
MTFRRLLFLILLAAALAAASNLLASRERKLVWVGKYPNALAVSGSPAPATSASSPAPAGADVVSDKLFPPHPDKADVEIPPSDADILYSRKALFLDARRSKVFEEGHVAGARSFPVWESDIDARVKAFFEEGQDPNQPIVIYCSGGNCEDSHMLAQKLYMVGFDNVYVYKDGFPDWEKRGRPVEKGAPPR